jgi:hypothetical protein
VWGDVGHGQYFNCENRHISHAVGKTLGSYIHLNGFAINNEPVDIPCPSESVYNSYMDECTATLLSHGVAWCLKDTRTDRLMTNPDLRVAACEVNAERGTAIVRVTCTTDTSSETWDFKAFNKIKWEFPPE